MEEMRKAIAAAMTRAKQTIPHFYLSETIDVEPAIRLPRAATPTVRRPSGSCSARSSCGDDARRAKVPVDERPLQDGAYRPSEGHQSRRRRGAARRRAGGARADGRAVAEPRQTMAGMRDLVTRARAGRLRSSEMTMGTITVSSLGDTGAEAMTGVIFPPQVALVGLGAPHLRPWVVDGEAVVPRNVVTLTVSADHRVSDGRQVARFIAAFETPCRTRRSYDQTDFRSVFLEELVRVAPTSTPIRGRRRPHPGRSGTRLDGRAEPRDRPARALGVDIPEKDYPEIATSRPRQWGRRCRASARRASTG
jgi:hypothetical protein